MATPDAQLGPGSRRIIRLREHEGQQSPEIVVDHWQRLRDDDPYPALDALPVLVSFGRLVREREQLAARPGELSSRPGARADRGVWLAGNTEPEEVAEAIAALPLVAIEVPKFTDGRHFSLARLLRERFGYTGDLRAFGDVLPDQLFYMRRCGYSSFELRPGQSLETGLRTLQAFSVTYQAAADQPPLFRRRA
jgi:uncharacterized protein (DUF934 family)